MVAEFERALAEYTGALYVVTTDSCTNAIFLSLQWAKTQWPGVRRVTLPRRTYVGVAHAVRNAGYGVEWREEAWQGVYALGPLPIIDAAKRFTSGMMALGAPIPTQPHSILRPLFMCVSFQAYKILPIGRGGAILTDSGAAAEWLRRARFDGRDPDNEDTGQVGWHMYLDPPAAARGLWLLHGLPRDNKDLPNEHEEISHYQCFRHDVE